MIGMTQQQLAGEVRIKFQQIQKYGYGDEPDVGLGAAGYRGQLEVTR